MRIEASTSQNGFGVIVDMKRKLLFCSSNETYMSNAYKYLKKDDEKLCCVSREKDRELVKKMFPEAKICTFKTSRLDFANEDFSVLCESFSKIIILSDTPFFRHLTKLIYKTEDMDFEERIMIDCNGDIWKFSKNSHIKAAFLAPVYKLLYKFFFGV